LRHRISLLLVEMTSTEASERLGAHGRNLWAAIRKVETLDKGLAEELGKEYDGLLKATSDILDRMAKHLEH
jgi:hypothetical protein